METHKLNVLKWLYPKQREPVEVKDLAKSMCLSWRQTMRVIHRLEKDGFLQVHREQKVHSYSVTPRGNVYMILFEGGTF